MQMIKTLFGPLGAGAGALLLAAANLASYVAGLVRDLVLASTFGAGQATDAFFAGFLIPDFLFNFLVLGFVSGALLPVFLSTAEKSRAQAAAVFQSFLTLVAVMTTGFAIAAYLLAPWLIGIFFGGLPDGSMRPQTELDEITDITRILLLSPILFGISNSLGMILLAKRRFLSIAVSPVLYNLGIILGIVLCGDRYGIIAAAWGAVGGAGLHLLSRALDFPATGVYIRPRLRLSPGLIKIIRLGIPKTLGLVAFQLVLVTFAYLATRTETGGLAAWNLARNVQSLPVSLFGIAFATAALPFLSSLQVADDTVGFRHRLQKSAVQILTFTLPAGIGLLLVAHETVEVLFQRGAFTLEDAMITTAVLTWVSLAIPFEALSHLFARAFLAQHNTIIPALGKLLFLAIAAGSAWLLTPHLGMRAFGIAFALAAAGEIIWLLGVFCVRYGSVFSADMMRSLAKVALATVLITATVVGFLEAGAALNAFGRLGGAIFFGAVVYFAAILGLRVPEVREVFLFRRNRQA